jgi:putative addiction module component (TIGR02574 family)
MSDREAILQQALALPPDDRPYLATALEQSLAGDSDRPLNEELLAELQRRSAAYGVGATTARAAADVLAALRRRQSGGTSA